MSDAQGARLLELAAAYRVARRKKFEASDDDFPAACVALLKATNALLEAALDCTDDDTPEEWWSQLRPYWRAYQRRAYRGYDCRVHHPPHKETHEHDQE